MARIAIVKPIKVRVGNLAGLRGVLNYIKADFKTKDGALVFGKDCFPEKAFEQMAITEKAFHKETGRQYAHFVQSFYRYDDLTAEQVQSAMLHSSIAGLFDQFEQWLWEEKRKEEMLNYEQKITGDTKEAEIYEEEYELY